MISGVNLTQYGYGMARRRKTVLRPPLEAVATTGERATVLVCHLAGNVRFETISDLD